jgi:inner membrane protein
MEPITHFLTGAAIGRTGFNRRSAYATIAACLAAEAADLDVLWSLRGPVEGLKHHRGISHTFLAAPFVALAVVAFLWALDRYWLAPRRLRRYQQREHIMATLEKGETPPPPIQLKISWPWVYLAAFVAALSHILLDFTNNYGIRPFFPFNARWYSLDLVFIAEPILWALFAAAFLIPAILGLTDREIGLTKPQLRGRAWAIFALTAMVALWSWRWFEHTHALNLLNSTQVATEPVLRIALEPYPINPTHWHAIIETEHTFQTAEVYTNSGIIDTDLRYDVITKPADTPALEAAKQTPLGRVYLDWGRWAMLTDLGPETIPTRDEEDLPAPNLPPPHHWTTVRFDDLRFQYSYLGTGRTDAPSPLTGWVYIVDDKEDAGEVYGHRVQR